MVAMSPWPHSIAIEWRRTHRLIVASYVDEETPHLQSLSRGVADLANLTELAAATNSRLAAQAGGSASGIGPDELVFEVPYSKIINAAFTYANPNGARFSGRTRGAWYAARSVRTSLAEVIFHRTVLLAETDWWDDIVDFQDLLSDIASEDFADLLDDDERSAQCLAPDSYVAGQMLAERLVGDGWSGVVYPSVRHAAGKCVACFRPALVSNVRLGERYRLVWSGSPRPRITTLH